MKLLSLSRALPPTVDRRWLVAAWAVGAGLWMIGADWLIAQLLADAAARRTAAAGAAAVLIAVSAGLAWFALRDLRPAAPADAAAQALRAQPVPVAPVALAALAIVLLTALGVWQAYRDVLARESARIEAISETRANEIAGWLRHRLGEGEFIRTSAPLAALHRAWERRGDTAARDELLGRIAQYAAANEYDGALLVDAAGAPVARERDRRPGALAPELRAAVMRAVATGTTQYTVIYRDGDAAGRLRMDFVVPLAQGGTPPRAAAVLRDDPRQRIYPALRGWPAPTATGETVLLRIADGQIHHMSKAPAGGTVPVATALGKARLVVRATADGALGRAVMGEDARGNAVLGAAHRIAGTDWLVVSRIDRAELISLALENILWRLAAGVVALLAVLVVGHHYRVRAALRRSRLAHAQQAEQLRALQLLDGIASSTDNPIFVKDRAGRYTFVNDAACRIMGMPREEVLGRDDDSLFPPAVAATVKQSDARVRDEGTHDAYEFELERDGERRTMSVTKGPLRDAGGAVIGTYGISRDITARKRPEYLQQEQARALEMIVQNAPLAAILQTILDGASRLLPGTAILLLLADGKDGALRRTAAAGAGAAALAAACGEGCTGDDPNLLRRESFIADLAAAPQCRRCAEQLAPHGLRSCWNTPIVDAGQELLGALALFRAAAAAPEEWERAVAANAIRLARTAIVAAAATAALERSETRYRSMVQALSEGLIMFDAAGDAIAANPAAERIFECDEAELIRRWKLGDASERILDERGQPLRHDERAVMRAIRSGEPQRNRVRGRRRANGSLRWYMVNAEPVRDPASGAVVGAIASYTNITELLIAEQELRKLSMAVEQSLSGIMITDTAGRIEYVNDAVVEASGYPRAELLGRNPRMLSAGRTPESVYDAMRGALAGGQPWRGEFVNRRKDGAEYEEISHISPLRQPDGNITHYVSITTDITERKRLAAELDRHRNHLEELVLQRSRELVDTNRALVNEVAQRTHAEESARRLNEALVGRQHALERAVKNLETFSYSVSHDLRAPLRAVNGYAEMLEQALGPRLGTDEKKMLERITGGVRRLDQLISDILDYSRSDRLEPAPREINLDALVAEIVREAAAAHPATAVAVGALPTVMADPAMTRQILANLIGNAFKFSAKRAGARVEIGAETVDGIAEIYVRDNGAGFDMRYANKLFSLFQRLHTQRDFPGTGVGLAIVKRLIERHGGQIRAESVPGERTEFRFTLAPAAGPAAAPQTAAA